MDIQYQYPAPAPVPSSAPYYSQQSQQPHQQPYDHYYYGHADHEGYPSSNAHYSNTEYDIHSSKQASPSPFNNGNSNEGNINNELDAANDGQTSKAHKGKIFQCTGFGDCRMVFTRSEHLARHARKHTGEKPFQCVVEGCTRMFSRFDNMVQHTQTHTKGAHPETTEEIANKIAIESRRKSEAGLLGGSTVRRASVKGPRAKRGSVSSASGSESPRKSRHERVHSMPMLNMTPASQDKRSSTPVLSSPITPLSSSPLSSKKETRQRSKVIAMEASKRHDAVRNRRGSLDTSVHLAPSESWYASKLHHRPSLDFGLDQHAFFANREARNDVSRVNNHLPSTNTSFAGQGGSFGHQSSSFSRLRHPLSPEHSSHSDMDSDDGSVHGQCPSTEDTVKPVPRAKTNTDARAVDPWDNCTLPPLRTSLFLPEVKPRLPSISFGRIRSQSITSGALGYLTEPYPVSKTRRLSLVDLNAPIQEANVAAHHSMLPHTGRTPGGVNVSEDEVKALEAFGQLWSQGRDVEMREQRQSTVPRIKTEFAPYEAPVPGPDSGRRPRSGNDDTYEHCRPETSMHLD